MQYTKQAMDFNCQLNILKERGLTIEDEEEAMKFLHSVSYFRFANYLQPMEHNAESHRFAQNSYTAPSFPPAWKTLEVVSFGTLSKLFCNFKDNSVKKKVAKEFLLPQYLYLENWIKCIAVLRNACAHHARIWNRRFPTMPIMPKYLPSQWVITGNFRPNKLYPQLCCLAYLEQSIAANGSFSKRLLKLIDKSESVNTRSMGFPQEWKNEPLWIIKAYC